MQNEALVSVIVPNYNHGEFLRKRIDSILSQTYQNIELILLDDCSTDNSIDIFKEYQEHPKVAHVLFHEKNSGSPFGLWEEGISLAKGNYVWIAESDDWSDEHFLEQLVNILERSDAVIAHCKSYNVSNENKVLNTWWDPFGKEFWQNDYIKDGRSLLQFYGKYRCPVMNVSSAVIKIEAIPKIEVPKEYNYNGDWWFWAQLFLRGNVAFIKDPLNFIRVHKRSVIRKKGSSLIKIRENIEIINRICESLDEPMVYSKNYEWLIDLWIKEVFQHRNYLRPVYYTIRVPWSFRVKFVKKYLKEVVNRLKN